VKTAISLPDALYERVQQHAERLGISRSEFFAVAARRWADELDGDALTAAIDEVVDRAGADDGEGFALAAARGLLVRGE
jgi:predicted transcriptional regulator